MLIAQWRSTPVVSHQKLSPTRRRLLTGLTSRLLPPPAPGNQVYDDAGGQHFSLNISLSALFYHPVMQRGIFFTISFPSICNALIFESLGIEIPF